MSSDNKIEIFTESFPSSSKVYVASDNFADVKVAMRQIHLSKNSGEEDVMVYDTSECSISENGMLRRRSAWKQPAFKATRGTLYKYIKNVKTASEGCVTDE